MKKLPLFLLAGSLFVIPVLSAPSFADDSDQVDVDTDDADIDDSASYSMDTSDKFSLGGAWNTLKHGAEAGYDFVKHGAEDAAKIGKKVGNSISKEAKKGLKAIEDLADPCKACKDGLGAGIDHFGCNIAAKAMVGETQECAASVAEEVPEYAPYSEELCLAMKFGIKEACNRMKDNDKVKKAESSIVSSACHQVGLCS